MKIIRTSIFILVLGLISCGQDKGNTASRTKIDPRAKALNDSAAAQAMHFEEESSLRAIQLLNQAIQIDSNYYTAYWNKLGLHTRLKQYDEALVVARHLVRLRPNSPEIHGGIGMLYEMTGDSVSSIKHFNQADVLYDQVLDTMRSGSLNYDMTLMNKGLNLIMIGKQQEGNKLLKQLYQNQNDTAFKELIAEYLDMDRQELIRSLKSKIE